MWDYTQAVHDHFLHPHNAGPMADANAVGEVGSLACGDALRLYLKISQDGKIEKASFETFGCASAIASSSVLTDMIVGMNVEEALKLTNKDIVANLGGLPREKMHCSVMGQEALEAAIRNWRGEPAMPHAQEIGKLVCKCFGVTDAQIIRTIRENNLTTLEEITDYTKAGGACGQCLDEISEILAAELAKRGEKAAVDSPKETAAKPKLTNLERMQKVMAVLASLKLGDGQEVQLVDVDGLKISVKLTSSDTKKLLQDVEQILREKVEDNLVLVEA
ncbi:MAG: Fe-S cluster assembly protein NifU [Desulfovibrionaceae bacterium]|nr:Fe-S cluster assembly protein NifU [Desulfovibrionaceae bacterium]